MTYIYVGYDFNYLSLITDAYFKKDCWILFASVFEYWEGCLNALDNALAVVAKKK
jgi:hypothetical protein